MGDFFSAPENEENFADGVDWELVQSNKRVQEVAAELSREQLLAVDTENAGLDPHTKWPLLLQIGTLDKCFIFEHYKGLDLSPLIPILESESIIKVLFQAKYDWKWITTHYNARMKNVFCAQVAERLLTVGKFGAHKKPALRGVVYKYLGIPLKKEVRSGFVNRDPEADPITEEEFAYSAADVVLLPDIYYQQVSLINELGIQDAARIEFEVLPIVANAELKGAYLDKDQWVDLLEQAEKKHEEISQRIYKSFGEVLSQKTLFGVRPFNISSQPQLLSNLKRLGFDLPDTQESTLKRYKNEHEVFKHLLDWRGFEKIVTSYGEKLLKKINPATKRLHCQYNQVEADCLPAGELVLTDRGYLPVEKVKVGDNVITHKGRPRKVIDTYLNGVKPIYRVELANGLSLRTTGNHPYMVKDGWVEAKNLSLGNQITIHSSPEVWKRVPEWEDFEVSSWGRVRNKNTNKILSLQRKNKWGHLKVLLHRNGAQKRGSDRKDLPVHRLVLKAFGTDLSDNKIQVRHLNGIAWDNTLNNLSVGTEQENKNDCVVHGSLSKRTKEHAQNKLSEEDVAFIRSYPYEKGVSDYILAERFGVHRAHIGDIRRGRRWENKKQGTKQCSFSTSSVISIEEQPNEMTYALTVEEDNSHVTGGIVTHNTGRMSAEKPNLQQVPGYDEDDPDSLDFRSCFKAEPGYKLVTADFSQQELRILADMSGDPTFYKAYTEVDENGEELDVHRYTASQVFQVPYDKVSDKQRKQAKTLNFFLVFGGGAFSLADTLKISEEEAQEIIDKYFARYSKIKYFLDSKANFAVNYGYIETISGRRRFLPMPEGLDPFSKEFRKAKSTIKRAGKNCVDFETEALTLSRGWVKGFDLSPEDTILTKNPETGKLEWQQMIDLKLFPEEEDTYFRIKSKSFEVITTPNHRWLVYNKGTGKNECRTTEKLSEWGDHRIHRTGDYEGLLNPVYSNNFVELCGWFITDGSCEAISRKTMPVRHRVSIGQSLRANPEKVDLIRKLLSFVDSEHREYKPHYRTKCIKWVLSEKVSEQLNELFPERELTMKFLSQLTKEQINILFNTMMLGDGSIDANSKRVFTAGSKHSASMFQVLCTMVGYSSHTYVRDMGKYRPESDKLTNSPKQGFCYYVNVLSRDKVQVNQGQKEKFVDKIAVWCPIVPNTYFVARRKGQVFITGNTPIQGSGSDVTKQAMIYVARRLEKEGYDASIIMVVHDELVVEAKEEQAEAVARIVEEEMVRGFTHFFKTIPMRVDAHIGDTWEK